jgi:hypothetical protein
MAMKQGCNRYCGSNFHHRLCKNEIFLLGVHEKDESARLDILVKLELIGCVPRQSDIEDVDCRDVVPVDREMWKMGVSEVPGWRERKINELKVEIVDSLLSLSYSEVIEPVGFLVISRSAIAQDCWLKTIEKVVNEKVPWPIIEGPKFDELALGPKDVHFCGCRVDNVREVLVRRHELKDRGVVAKTSERVSAVSYQERFQWRVMCSNLKGSAVRSRDCIVCFADVNNIDELASGICRRCRAVHADVESELRYEREMMSTVRNSQKFDDTSTRSFKQSYNMLNSSIVQSNFVVVNQPLPRSAADVSWRPYCFAKLTCDHKRIELYCCGLSQSIPKKNREAYRRCSNLMCGGQFEVFKGIKSIVGRAKPVLYGGQQSETDYIDLAVMASYPEIKVMTFSDALRKNRFCIDYVLPHELSFTYWCFILTLRIFFDYSGPLDGYERLWNFIQEGDDYRMFVYNEFSQSEYSTMCQSAMVEIEVVSSRKKKKSVIDGPETRVCLQCKVPKCCLDFRPKQWSKKSGSKCRTCAKSVISKIFVPELKTGVKHESVSSEIVVLETPLLRNDDKLWLGSSSDVSTKNFEICPKCLDTISCGGYFGFCNCEWLGPPFG